MFWLAVTVFIFQVLALIYAIRVDARAEQLWQEHKKHIDSRACTYCDSVSCATTPRLNREVP